MVCFILENAETDCKYQGLPLEDSPIRCQVYVAFRCSNMLFSRQDKEQQGQCEVQDSV